MTAVSYREAELWKSRECETSLSSGSSNYQKDKSIYEIISQDSKLYKVQ